ncbi:MAG: signal peptidase II [Selenomonadaceae bacterium]
MPVLVCISIVILDQIVKFYIQSMMLVGMSIPVVTDVFHITYILNPGAAFGILENQRMFFILIGTAILCAAIYFYSYIKKENIFIRYGVSMLLGGAVGNLIDRIRIGYVIDFFDFRIWPIFNIADIAIVVGVGCIVYSVLFSNKLK